MKRYVHILWTALLIWGCGEKLIEPPEDLIPPEQMTDILYDISIMDAIESNYPNALERNDIRVMEWIQQKYGIDSARFAASDLYYASQPQQYERIYEALHERLLAERDSLNEAIRKKQGAAEKDTGEAEESP